MCPRHQTAAILLLTPSSSSPAPEPSSSQKQQPISQEQHGAHFIHIQHTRVGILSVAQAPRNYSEFDSPGGQECAFLRTTQKGSALPDLEPWWTPDGLEAAKPAPSNSCFRLSALAEGNPISQNQSCLSTSCSSAPLTCIHRVTQFGRSELGDTELQHSP